MGKRSGSWLSGIRAMKLTTIFEEITHHVPRHEKHGDAFGKETEFLLDDQGHFQYDRHGQVKTFNPNGFLRNLLRAGLAMDP